MRIIVLTYTVFSLLIGCAGNTAQQNPSAGTQPKPVATQVPTPVANPTGSVIPDPDTIAKPDPAVDASGKKTYTLSAQLYPNTMSLLPEASAVGTDGIPTPQLYSEVKLAAGATLNLTSVQGKSIYRIKNGSDNGSWNCPTNWRIDYKDAAGTVLPRTIAERSLDTFNNSPQPVPENAVSIWIGFFDSMYGDNEGAKTLSSGPSGGCSFTFELKN